MRVTCEKHPELTIYDLRVRFCKGAAQVTEKQAEHMRSMTGYGFVFEPGKGGEGNDATGKAKGKAAKG